jgi:hypothetical protein
LEKPDNRLQAHLRAGSKKSGAGAKMSRRPPCVSANAERARGPRRNRYLDCEIKPGE